MKWRIEYARSVQKTLKKMDGQTREKIRTYLESRILEHDDPRTLGKELRGNLGGFWRYRVSDIRIICELQNDRLVVLVVRVGHRKNVYET